MSEAKGPAETRFERLATNWVYGAALFAPILLLLTPFVAHDSTDGQFVWAALGLYLLHQYEEHDSDRFRVFVNAYIAKNRRGLSRSDVLWINVLGVWVVLALTFALTLRVDSGWAALALYLLGINAVVHLAQAIALRRYNPGLVTAVILFLPMAFVIGRTLDASLGQHLVSAGLVILLHAAIIWHAARPAT